MGNTTSASPSVDTGKQRRSSKKVTADDPISARAQKVVGDFQTSIASGIKKLEEQDHPAAALLDSMCGPYLDKGMVMRSYNSEDYNSEDDSRTVSEEETTVTDYHSQRRKAKPPSGSSSARADDETTMASRSYASEYDASTVPDSTTRGGGGGGRKSGSGRRAADDASSYETDDNDTYAASRVTTATSAEETTTVATAANTHPKNSSGAMTMLSKQPLASSFAKRCYFTKSGIGGHTQHYEGLTLTGNVVLLLAAAMKLKGCPTICDEDLRRVEQTYPNQFSRLPDELLLSSGWRRISKYCHFSNKPIPDGIPFFHSKQRLHPSGGYYFLLAAAVGMVRPIDVEPLNRDTLVLLETDYPSQCDSAPAVLIQDPAEWTLVDKFCFFSGGPINTDEDVYYMADFDGNPIYMLAFLSPSLTPSELYKLDSDEPLGSTAAVEEVESVYDLTERDFDDLKLYHLGPCRALPQYILQPQAWTKVLPPHFLAARETALIRAQEYEDEYRIVEPRREQHPYMEEDPEFYPDEQRVYAPFEHPPPTYGQQQHLQQQQHHLHPQQLYPYGVPQHYGPQHQQQSAPQPSPYGGHGHERYDPKSHQRGPAPMMQDNSFLRNAEEEGAFIDNSAPLDEAIATHAARAGSSGPMGIDPPEDEPPSLRKRGAVYEGQSVSSADPSQRSSVHEHGESVLAYAQGSAYNDGSAYDDEDGMDPRNNYYSEEADNYGDENLRDRPYRQGDDDDFVPREQFRHEEEYGPDELPPDDEFGHEDAYDGQQEYQPDDAYDDREDEYQPDDEYYDRESNIARGRCDDITPQPSEEPFSSTYSGDDDFNEVGMEQVTSPTSGSEFSAPTIDEGVFVAGALYMSPNTSAEYSNPPPETTRRGNTALSPPSHFPPMSPRSAQGSEYSQSSAMRGAQELLRRNRLKRLELAQKRKPPVRQPLEDEGAPDDEVLDVASPQSQDSASTWHTGVSETTGSEATGGGSSIWTDGENNPDRSSRRALILQMARARMKSQGKTAAELSSTVPAAEERKPEHLPREALAAAANNEIDLTGDLD